MTELTDGDNFSAGANPNDEAWSNDGHVAQRRRRRWFVGATVVVLLVATVASFVSLTATTTATVSSAQVAAVNIQRGDLPVGWHDAPSALLTALVGPGGYVQTANTPQPKLRGLQATIWSSVTHGFQRCVGVSNRRDRLFGAAGQLPAVQVTGSTFASLAFGGSELASLTQYYADPTMVTRDLAEYRRSAFGSCFSEANAQLLASSVSGRLQEARAHYPVVAYTPVTFAHGFRRGGIATVTLLGTGTGPSSLVTLFFAVGHYEVNVYALTPQWTQLRPTALAAVDAVLARLSVAGHAGAA